MLTDSELRFVYALAELERRGISHQHRTIARLCGWRSSSRPYQVFEKLVKKGFVEIAEDRLPYFGRRRRASEVVVDAGPRLTQKAREFLSQKAA